LTVEVGTASSVFNIENTNGIQVYPNPVNDVIYFEIDPSLLKEQLEVQLYDILGNLIDKQQYNQYSLEYQFIIKNMPTGIYFLTLKIDEHQYNKKILIENN